MKIQNYFQLFLCWKLTSILDRQRRPSLCTEFQWLPKTLLQFYTHQRQRRRHATRNRRHHHQQQQDTQRQKAQQQIGA